MMFVLRQLLTGWLLFMITCTQAQDAPIGNWMIYFGNFQANEKFNIHHEIQYRNYALIGDLEQLLIRVGLGYDLTDKNNNILIGYGFIHGQNYVDFQEEKVKSDEHRIYEQFITKQSFPGISLQHRYRFEQRFIGDDFRLRFRYFLGLNVPISGKTMADRTWYLSAYNEIFLNTQGNVFDRNRLYGGVGYRLNGRVRFEAGYMNQFLSQGSRDQINLMVFVAY